MTFGHAIREAWPLDPAVAYLNHGTVGVTPNVVLAAQAEIRARIERQPAKFMLRELKPALREAAGVVAGFLGGAGEDWVFVDNATTGISAVLRSLPLTPNDTVLINNQTYGGVKNAARFACRQAGARLDAAEVPFPINGPDAAVAAIEVALTPETRLVLIDHIVSETGLVMPVAEIAALCRRHGARVLVDGAHAPGQIDVNVPALGVDWYVGNLHKWAFAPRGCGVMWRAPDSRDDLHPPVISWGLDESYTAEFDWTGTRDPSAYLAAPAGIAFLEDLGIEAAAAYRHDLLRQAAEMLRQRWAGPVGAPADMTGSMALAALPDRFAADRETAQALRDQLLFEHDIEVPVLPWQGRLWARLSAQVYNELSDFERLADAV